jgi:Na+/melibiose symporter-like transporter
VLGGLALVRLTAYLMGNYPAGQGGDGLWLALGIISAILFAVLFVTVATVKERPGNGATKSNPLSTVCQSFNIDLKASRDFVIFLAARGLLWIPAMMLPVFALYYLKDVIGVPNPASAAANLVVVVGVSLFAVVYPAGLLSDKVGRKPMILSCGLLGVAGALSLFFSHTYTHILLSAVPLGIAMGGLISSTWALATDLVPKGEEARYLGLTNLSSAGSAAIAYLMGPAIDFFNGIKPQLGYQVMLLSCPVCFLAGTLLVMNIRKSTRS